jgi:GH35 family endo-1,4-beta-xylanase
MLNHVLLAILLASTPAFAQTPQVSLLTDLSQYTTTGPIRIRELLPLVQLRKLALFRFGSTHDIFLNETATAKAFTNNVFSTVFNHVVAENGCKWYDTEPERGVHNLTDCKGVSQYALEHLASFRG